MNPENILVPFHVSDLPPAPWVVFAPHADDETFGMGGALRLAALQGLATHVIVLTDGALGGATNPDDQQALVAQRKKEVQQACDILGVSSVQTWDHADRGLQMDDVVVEQITGALTDLQAATVFFPGVLELHPDHRVTAQLVWAAVQRLQQRAWRGHLPEVWSYEISVQSPVNRLIDISSTIEAKQQAMAVYASQNSQNNYPELILALNKARTFSMSSEVKYVEAFNRYDPGMLAESLEALTQQAVARYFERRQTKP
jgi:N-acetylglucosamine malate deacetylase 1